MSRAAPSRVPMPRGFSLRFYQQLDSTSDEAKRLARKGEEGNVWVLARRQSRGRGRHGRGWVSQEGNLFASLLVYSEAPRARFSELSLLAAVAVAEGLEAFVKGRAEVACKWPNDVLIDDSKVAGILLESEDGKTARPWAVIGIGVNLARAPEKVDYPAGKLADYTDKNINVFNVMERIAEAFAAHLGDWRRGGFAPLREAWLSRAWALGERVAVESGGDAATGVFEGLSPGGALLLRGNRGQCREIVSGTLRRA